jgi:hypothetical protein
MRGGGGCQDKVTPAPPLLLAAAPARNSGEPHRGPGLSSYCRYDRPRQRAGVRDGP